MNSNTEKSIINAQWSNYIKIIPENNYYLTFSCILGSFYPASEVMVAKLYDILKINWCTTADSNNGWTCCTGIGFHGDIMPVEASILTIARLWSLAKEVGMDAVTPTCVTSYGMYCECKSLLENDEALKEKIDKILYNVTGRKLYIPEHLIHVSDVYYLYKDIMKDNLFKYNLVNSKTSTPLKVVDHVGCHYSKLFPEKAVGGSEYCDVLAGMVRSWGGINVDYPERRHCCGMGFRQSMITPNRAGTMASVLKKMRSMNLFKPDFIITNCPGCQLFLDKMQYPIFEITGENYQIPVLTYQEVAGLLMGWDPYKVVGIQFHNVPVEPLLDKIGIPYKK
jgi:heterodisulfide reductase subunit B